MSTVRSRALRIAAPTAALAVIAAGLVPAASAQAAGALDTMLVVSQTSNGGADTAPFSLQTVDTSGATHWGAVQLPTGGATPFTMGGASDAGGYLTTAADGSGVALGGFKLSVSGGATLGDPKSLSAAVAPREAAFVANSGTDADRTHIYGLGTTMNGGVRAAATADGSNIYVSGNDDSSGIQLVNSSTGATPVKISKQKNYRSVGIFGGQLYGSEEKTAPIGVNSIGSGLPTTQVSADTSAVPTVGTGNTPNGFVFLSDGAGGTYSYVLVEGSGIQKFYKGPSDSAFTAEGTIASTGTDRALAGRWVDGVGAELFTIDGVATDNHVIRFVDADTTDKTVTDATGPVTVATAASGYAFHGVTVAPAGWQAPQPPLSVTASGATVVPTEVGSGSATTSMDVTASDANTGAKVAGASLAATVTSGGSVITGTTVTSHGDGTFTVSFARGAGIGVATVAITASAAGYPDGSTTYTLAQSAKPDALADASYLDGAADASAAIDAGTTGADSYALVADDEDDVIRLYDVTAGGAPTATFDLGAAAGLNSSKEADFEAAARVGNDIYWFGSLSDDKDSVVQPDRDVIVKTTVSGTGSATTLTYAGKRTGLRSAIVSWATAADPALAAACTTTGMQNYPDNANGCNLEGVEFAPGSTSTVYLAFRAPVEAAKAVLVPLTNLPDLFAATPATPNFGAELQLDLGGRGIRDIRKNAAGQYLLTAGAPDDQAAITPNWELYSWNGQASGAPVMLTSLPDYQDTAKTLEAGSWETILSVPPAITAAGARVQLVADNGTTPYYSPSTQGKDIAPMALQKDVAAWFSTAEPPTPAGTASLPTTIPHVGVPVAATAAGWGTASLQYAWAANGVTIPNATGATFTPTAAQLGQFLTVTVTGQTTYHRPTSVTSLAAPAVEAGTLAVATPRIVGTRAVGSVLTVAKGTWTRGTTFTYQWKANGVSISKATKSTFTPTVTQYAKKLTVTITGSLAGYTKVARTSGSTAAIAHGKLVHTPTPRITGTIARGHRITLHSGSWDKGTHLTYRWYSDGRLIRGQSHTTLLLTSTMRGHRITGKVTGTKSGYLTTAKNTARTRAVR